jgi:hypothetical protein
MSGLPVGQSVAYGRPQGSDTDCTQPTPCVSCPQAGERRRSWTGSQLSIRGPHPVATARGLDRAPSVEARDGSVLWGRVVAKIEHDLVDVAPAPAFRRVVALDDRMLGAVEMRRRVAMGRLIAAADMAAGSADPQVEPGGADPQAILAALGTWPDVSDPAGMGAGRHGSTIRLIPEPADACRRNCAGTIDALPPRRRTTAEPFSFFTGS